jgi:hypothetical protein
LGPRRRHRGIGHRAYRQWLQAARCLQRRVLLPPARLPPPPSSLSTSGFRGGGGEVLGRDAGQLGGLTQSVRRRVPDEGHDPVSARAIELAFLVVARLRRGHFPVSVDVAYCKQKLFRDAVLLGCLLDLLHQRRALLGQDAVGARGFEQGHHGDPCPAQLQKSRRCINAGGLLDFAARIPLLR